MREDKHTKVEQKDRQRAVSVALILGCLFALLIVQFFRIQVVQGKKWESVAEGQHYFRVEEPFVRGSIYSDHRARYGHSEAPRALAMDLLKFHLYIDPKSIPAEYRDEVASRLAELAEITDAQWEGFRSNFDRNSRSRKLKMWITREERDVISDWWRPFAHQHKIARNAVYFIGDYQRSYPFGGLLGAVLHTVRGYRDEQTKQAIPTGGLELQFNEYLKGELGERRLMRSPRNRLATGDLIRPAQNGADVFLTIDHTIQQIAEEELAIGVERAGAKSGWAAMMNPHTGELLAIAQYPPFHPEHYAEYFNDPEKMLYTRVRAVTDMYEPGSTMKPIGLAVSLEANRELAARGEKLLFDPEEKLPTWDGSLPGRKPMTDVTRHRFLNMDMAVRKSSNIYFARIAERLVDRFGGVYFRDHLVNVFGLGQTPAIELPGVSSGLLPTPGKYHSSGLPEWSTPTPFSLAIGYNLQVNSIQLLRAWSVLANGGRLIQPTLLRQIVQEKPDGSRHVLVDNTQPERVASFPQVLSQQTTDRLLQSLRFVTKEGGSAKRANLGGYTEVGKSGTARKIEGGQYTNKKHFASFIGFTPADNPAFVLTVVIDEPRVGYIPGVGHGEHGGACAAPVFRTIAKRTLEYLGVAPDDPYGYPVGDPRRDPDLMDWGQENRELSELYQEWNG